MLFTTISCVRNETRLHTGDLLFQAGKNSEMTEAITSATGDEGQLNWSHVGIAIVTNGAQSVLEASDSGVRIVALDEFLDRAAQFGGRPAVAVMRLRDTTGVGEAVRRARTCLRLPYDYSFRPGNGSYYCSELVWENYLRPDGSRIFPARPMNFRASDGTTPPFWTELFARLGEPVPQGVPGTNPNDMARDTALRIVYRYYK